MCWAIKKLGFFHLILSVDSMGTVPCKFEIVLLVGLKAFSAVHRNSLFGSSIMYLFAGRKLSNRICLMNLSIIFPTYITIKFGG